MGRQGLITLVADGWRVLQSSSTTTEYDDDDVWTPLRKSDYVHLGITIGYQVLVVLVVAHLWLCRTWPPYIPRYDITYVMLGFGLEASTASIAARFAVFVCMKARLSACFIPAIALDSVYTEPPRVYRPQNYIYTGARHRPASEMFLSVG